MGKWLYNVDYEIKEDNTDRPNTTFGDWGLYFPKEVEAEVAEHKAKNELWKLYPDAKEIHVELSMWGEVEDQEKKTERVNGLFTPTVYNNLKTLSEIDGTSFNNLLHEIAKAYTNKRIDEIDDYVFKQALIAKMIEDKH